MKKLAYITGSRAEYGIVKRLLLKLQSNEDIDFSVIVTAMHLDRRYGYTIDTLIQDGINISHKIPLNLDSSSNTKIIDSMAECLSAFGNLFQEEKYDAIIILGDRYEMLSVAIAAAIHNIPIIHLHGGEKHLETMMSLFGTVLLRWLNYIWYQQRDIKKSNPAWRKP